MSEELIYDDEDGALDQRIRTKWGGGRRRVVNIAEVPRRTVEEETENERATYARLVELKERQAAGGLNAGVEVDLEL